MSSSTTDVSPATRDNSFWAILKEAFRGSDRDFTQGPIVAAIIILAIPMILEMSMESIFALVDTYFVARLGADAIAVVSLTESVIALVYAVAIGLGIGATATIARRVGEKDLEAASTAAAHVIYLGLVISVIIGIFGLIFASDILWLLGGEPSVVELGTPFMQIMLGSNAVIVFLFLLNAIFRGAGDAAIAMRVLILANALNIILDPIMIFGFLFFPELGVTGAALATAIGRGVGVLYAAWSLFFREGGRIAVRRRHWRLDPKLLWSLTRISSVAVAQFLISTASWTGLVIIIAAFGTVAIAGYQIGMRMIIFVILPAAGIANAAATLVGQNLGAGQPERAERTVWIAGSLNALVLGLAGLVFIFFAESVVRFFTVDPAIVAYGRDCLVIVGYGYAFYGLGMVLESSFNGAGDTATPMFINFFIFWILEMPLAYLLAHNFGFGPNGIFWAITISFSALTVVSGLLFRRGKWKSKVI